MTDEQKTKVCDWFLSSLKRRRTQSEIDVLLEYIYIYDQVKDNPDWVHFRAEIYSVTGNVPDTYPYDKSNDDVV